LVSQAPDEASVDILTALRQGKGGAATVEHLVVTPERVGVEALQACLRARENDALISSVPPRGY
jgi:hypothetical protein